MKTVKTQIRMSPATCKFTLTQGIYTDVDENIVAPVYGITARCQQSGEVLFLPNITTSRSKVEELIEKLTAGNVSLCHVRDIISDYIG